jgi:hypothetical protein
MSRGQWSERAEAQRAAAVGERHSRRNVAAGRHLPGEARHRAVGNGEKDNGAWSGPQRAHQRRHPIACGGQKHSMTGAPPRARQAPAEVAPARDD